MRNKNGWYFVVGAFLLLGAMLWGVYSGPKPSDACYMAARGEADIHADKNIQTVNQALASLEEEGFYPEYDQRYLRWSSRVGNGRVTHGYSEDSLGSWWNLPSCLSK